MWETDFRASGARIMKHSVFFDWILSICVLYVLSYDPRGRLRTKKYIISHYINHCFLPISHKRIPKRYVKLFHLNRQIERFDVCRDGIALPAVQSPGDGQGSQHESRQYQKRPQNPGIKSNYLFYFKQIMINLGFLDYLTALALLPSAM